MNHIDEFDVSALSVPLQNVPETDPQDVLHCTTKLKSSSNLEGINFTIYELCPLIN